MRHLTLRPSPRHLAAPILLVLVLLLTALPASGAPGTAAPPHAGVAPVRQARLTTIPSAVGPPAAVHPEVTTNYDWDPQPLILPPGFLEDFVGGLGAGMVTSDPLRTVVLFGGLSPNGLSNFTISVNQSTAAWTVTQPTSAPSPRANFSFAATPDGRRAILFGGDVDAATGRPDNQTWVYDFANRTWTNVTQAIAPPPRESAAFAIDTKASVGILEGGWDPVYSVGGVGAAVTWNDTWEINLTTYNWTELVTPTTPRPLSGSEMVYAPPYDEFLMFGGCLSSCSSTLYSYRLGGNWTVVHAIGDLPGPRGGASFAWGPAWNLAVLFGGGLPGANSYVPFNDTYVFNVSTHQWDQVFSADEIPNPTYDAAASFLSANNCPGMFLVGGSSALTSSPPSGWFLDNDPDLGSGCNNWGGDEVGGTGNPPPGNCSAYQNLTVNTFDSATGAPIPQATVVLIGKCGSAALLTGADGLVTFLNLPNETIQITATAPYYHPNGTFVNLSRFGSTFLPLPMVSLPNLIISAVGVTYPNVSAPLSGVIVQYYDGPTIGTTDVNGSLIVRGFAGPQGSLLFEGYRPYYSNASTTVTIPFTGNLSFSFRLLADGLLAIQAKEFPDGTGIADALGVITPVGAYTYGGPISFQTGANGWFNATVPQANYSVFLRANGFVSNATPSVFHPWLVTTVVSMFLTLGYGANLSVRLVDAHTHQPIAGGNVTVGYSAPKKTNADGWATFTDILPPGRYVVSGNANDYLTNSTALDLTYLERAPSIWLNLTPLSFCPPNCRPVNETPGVYALLPSGGTSLELFVFAPFALAIVAALYVAYLRRPRTEAVR